MKISAFTFVRNAEKLAFPLKESMLSIMDMVDEFVVAAGDSDDATSQMLSDIERQYPGKVRIVDTVWDRSMYTGAAIYAQQTDIAKMHCTGDWLFYLQSDEAVHQKYHREILEKCNSYLDDESVEGFLFRFVHLWGDFSHETRAHSFYSREIRIIRNRPDIHSWRDAQSFRVSGPIVEDYHRKEGTRKLRVVELDAEIYHYGWARHPKFMQNKNRAAFSLYNNGKDRQFNSDYYCYGNLNKFPIKPFKGEHPASMKEFVSRCDWEQHLRTDGPRCDIKFKHLLISYVEQAFLGCFGRLFSFNNYVKLKK